jgi:iron complex transport system substrate-binding protein
MIVSGTMRLLKLRLAAAAIGLLVFGCSSPAHDGTPVNPGNSAIPQRIISVVPSATEMLFAFGAGDKVVGIGDYDTYPPEVNTKPRIGGLLNPNIERIIELRPDMVVTYGSQEVLRQRLVSLGIRMFPFTHGSIRETLQFMTDLGRTVGSEEQAKAIQDRIHHAFDEVRANAPTKHPKVLIVHNRAAGIMGSFYSVGSRAFQHELLEIAGGENIFGDVDKEVIQPSIEQIVSRRPDIIIETLPPPLNARELNQRMQDWESMNSLPAVQNHRVYMTEEEYLLVPGPRLDLGARRFGDLIRR